MTSTPHPDIIIHTSFLPHTDPEASRTFYGDVLGFEIRNDVGHDTVRWLTVGPTGQPDVNVVLYPPTADPGISEAEGRTITEMMAKGTFASIMLATTDLDGSFDRIQAAGAEIMQEPTDQPWGKRDCAFRDPAGNTVRMQQL